MLDDRRPRRDRARGRPRRLLDRRRRACASAAVRIGAERDDRRAQHAAARRARSASGAEIAPGSAVFGRVPAGQRWAGSPAERVGKAAPAGRAERPPRRTRWLVAYGASSRRCSRCCRSPPSRRAAASSRAGMRRLARPSARPRCARSRGWSRPRSSPASSSPGCVVVVVRLLAHRAARGAASGAQPHRLAGLDDRAAARPVAHDPVPAVLEPVHARCGCGCSAPRSARDVEASTVLLIPSMTTIGDGAFLADDTMVASYELRRRLDAASDRARDRQAGVPRQLGHGGRRASACRGTGSSPCSRRRRAKSKAGSSWLGSPAGAAAPHRRRGRREPHLPAAGPAAARPRPVGALPDRPRDRHVRHRPRRAVRARVRSLARRACSSTAAAQRRRHARRRRGRRAGVDDREVGLRRAHPGGGASALVERSSGAPRCRTRSSRWSRRRGSPSAAAGTPALAVWLRTLGARIGRGVWCDSYWLPEADLVTLGDGSTVNRGCVVQTHLFHDRIMSMDAVDLEPGATLGPHSVILPAARDRRARDRRPRLARDARRGGARRQPLERQPDRPVARRAASPTTTRRCADATAAEIGVDTAGDPYLPQSGNGGYSTISVYDLDLRLPRRPQPARRHRRAAAAAAHQRLARFSLDLVGLSRRRACASTGAGRTFRPGARQAPRSRPQRPIEAGAEVARRSSSTAAPRSRVARLVGHDRLGGARRRRARGVAAVGRADVVPVQRPPVRQGDATASASRRMPRTPSWPTARSRTTGSSAGRASLGLRPARAHRRRYLVTVQIGRYAKRVARVRRRRVRRRTSRVRSSARCEPTSPRCRGCSRCSRSASGPYPFERLHGRRDGRRARDPARGAGARGLRREPRRRRRRRASGSSPTSSPTSGSATASGVARWQDIWLNEGFACYAEWLWSEASGQATADTARPAAPRAARAPARRTSCIGDPGPANMFDDRVYKRGALTLHALRRAARRRRVLRRCCAPGRRTAGTARRRRPTSSRSSPRARIATSRAFFEAWLYHPALPALPAAGPVTGGAGGSAPTATLTRHPSIRRSTSRNSSARSGRRARSPSNTHVRRARRAGRGRRP